MKKSVFLLLISIMSFASFSQSWEWANAYGETGWDSGYGVAVDSNGDVYISGVVSDSAYFGATTIYGPSNFLAKIDSMGNTIWAKMTFANSYQAPKLAADNTGGIYYYSNLPADTNIIDNDTLLRADGALAVIKFNGNGDILWHKNFAKFNTGYVHSGGLHYKNDLIYITGDFFDTLQLENDLYLGEDGGMFLVTYDTQGNEQWSAQFGTIYPGFSEHSYDVTSDQSGNAYVSGTFKAIAIFGSDTIIPQTNCSDAYLTKINPTGQCEWVVHDGLVNPGPSSGMTHITYGYAVTCDDIGGVYYGGDYNAEVEIGDSIFSSMGVGIFLAKYDTDGDFQWAVNNLSGVLLDLSYDNNGNVFANGTFSDSLTWGQTLYSTLAPNTSDMFLVKLDTSGAVQWMKDAGGGITWTKMSDPPCGSSRIYVVGHYQSGPAYFDGANLDSVLQSNIYLASVVNPFPACSNLSNNELSENGQILVYPNPSHTIFNVQFQNSNNQVALFDLSGKQIAIQQNNGLLLQIDATSLPKGVYVLRIERESDVQSTLLIVN